LTNVQNQFIIVKFDDTTAIFMLQNLE